MDEKLSFSWGGGAFLSIVIPVYNREKFIRECLDSIVNQPVDFSAYEIICIDDGSVDNSLSILKEYEKNFPHIKVFSQENQGASSARNHGIDKATGKYIWFIDSDDYIYENVLKDIFKVLIDENPGILIIPTNEIVEEFSGCIVRDESLGVAMYSWGNIALLQDINDNNIRFHKNIRFGEDTVFWYTLYAYTQSIVFYRKNVYSYRRHDGSIMFNAYKDIETINRRTLDIVEACLCFQKLLKSKKSILNVRKEKINTIKNDLFQYMMEEVFPFSDLPYKQTMRKLKKNNLYPCKFKKVYLYKVIKCKKLKEKLMYLLLFLTPIEIFYRITYKHKHKKQKISA